MQPLPSPIGVDIQSRHGLRRLAIHAYSLKKNWSSERAVPVSVRTIALGDDYEQIHVIPGTNIVVTDSSRRLACWHTQSGACLGVIEHEQDANHVAVQSLPFHLCGQSYIGLCKNSTLIVVKIDYHNQEAITVSKIYSNVSPPNEFNSVAGHATAVDDKTIGVVFAGSRDLQAVLVYSNFNDTTIRRVPLGMFMGYRPVCILHNGHFYIHGQDQTDPATVLRVRVEFSCTTNASDIDRITMEIPASIPTIHTKSTELKNPRLLPPTYGVALVTRRSVETLPSFPGAPQRIPNVQFWPAADNTLGHLEFGTPVFYEHNFDITTHVVGISGRYAALVDMEPFSADSKRRNNLGLVHYAAHPTPHTSFHLLDTGGVNLDYYNGVIALDDALGVVYYAQIRAGAASTLFVLSYA
ncbi:hypothetical protein B0H19DRAFT_109081 [Mycena capillaripes]|nr:hypothetical protein B0H19DRAFT_109081 [Mycena capillaripes]